MDVCEGMPENVINSARRSELLHSFITATFIEKDAEHKKKTLERRYRTC